MEYYRRHRRHYTYRQPTSPVLKIAAVLLIVAALAAAVAFSPIGDILSEKIIAPVAKRFSEGQAGDKTATVFANATAKPTLSPTEPPVQSDTFLIKSNPFYLLQMGHYASEADARAASAQIQSMGGGGYVMERDGVYRLFAAAYLDAESLNSVRKQIRSDGYESDAYITDSKTMRITLKGAAEAIQAFEDAIELIQSVPVTLSETTLAFDKKTTDRSAVGRDLQRMESEMSVVLEKLQSIDSKDIRSVCTVLEKYRDAVSTFVLTHDSMREELYAGALKHLQLSLIHAYGEFFET